MENIFKSRTIWVLIVIFVINGIAGIRESIPTSWLTLIDAVLSILAAYFRIAPKVEFGGMKKTAPTK